MFAYFVYLCYSLSSCCLKNLPQGWLHFDLLIVVHLLQVIVGLLFRLC